MSWCWLLIPYAPSVVPIRPAVFPPRRSRAPSVDNIRLYDVVRGRILFDDMCGGLRVVAVLPAGPSLSTPCWLGHLDLYRPAFDRGGRILKSLLCVPLDAGVRSITGRPPRCFRGIILGGVSVAPPTICPRLLDVVETLIHCSKYFV